jgi:hypothetical protein
MPTHAAAVTGDLVQARSKAVSVAEKAWAEARRNNDFPSLRPKLAEVLNLVRQVASGGPNLFFDLTILAAGASVVLALQSREFLLAKSLNHWDEAALFWLISHLRDGLLGL